MSICSNVPGHTDPEHISSIGDPQQLVDNFVQALLEIQETRETVLRQDFEEEIEKLDIYCMEAEADVRGLKPQDHTAERNDVEQDQDQSSDDDDQRDDEERVEEEVVESRKGKGKLRRRG